ncbi:addiction module toxin RelE [Marinilactibacillus sp. XAAS-LB27]|uniref:addiction module toxin RelE n=1 Tax=Marinilactibacillus sp. XAAS-LB27 TaxID=3114538 RepID=UPI002E186D76|nr:addiction module toxin RelE [Marinilactibacillus sp. XAAS-LB27]
MNKIVFWKEAAKEYKNMDGNSKQWVNIAIERLELKGSSIGKLLGNTQYAKLSGFKELKNQKLGLRMIYKATDEGQIEVIEIIVIGKREDAKVFKEAEKRRVKRIEK